MDQRLNAEDAVKQREQFVRAWNDTLIRIWLERIVKLRAYSTRFLFKSLKALPVRDDGRFIDFEVAQMFSEYGLWVDMGVGREFKSHSADNAGDLKILDKEYRRKHGLDRPRKRGPKWGGGYTSGRPRKEKPWFSIKYYASVMRLKEFLAESIGQEFLGLFAGLDADKQRSHTNYYKQKGWS